ncbi:MAG: hypothetical protein LE169_05645, partial [Endomicrobium sp.]|nr:hypothetical protein [Endomicrobium sp.]
TEQQMEVKKEETPVKKLQKESSETLEETKSYISRAYGYTKEHWVPITVICSSIILAAVGYHYDVHGMAWGNVKFYSNKGFTKSQQAWDWIKNKFKTEPEKKAPPAEEKKDEFKPSDPNPPKEKGSEEEDTSDKKKHKKPKKKKGKEKPSGELGDVFTDPSSIVDKYAAMNLSDTSSSMTDSDYEEEEPEPEPPTSEDISFVDSSKTEKAPRKHKRIKIKGYISKHPSAAKKSRVNSDASTSDEDSTRGEEDEQAVILLQRQVITAQEITLQQNKITISNLGNMIDQLKIAADYHKQNADNFQEGYESVKRKNEALQQNLAWAEKNIKSLETSNLMIQGELKDVKNQKNADILKLKQTIEMQDNEINKLKTDLQIKKEAVLFYKNEIEKLKK